MRSILQKIQATIDINGEVHLLQPVKLDKPAQAVVTILSEDFGQVGADETAILSEASLAEDWNRPEEDEAWAYMQPDRNSSALRCFSPYPSGGMCLSERGL